MGLGTWESSFPFAVSVLIAGVVETMGEGMKVRLPIISPLILTYKSIFHCPACNTETILPSHLA